MRFRECRQAGLGSIEFGLHLLFDQIIGIFVSDLHLFDGVVLPAPGMHRWWREVPFRCFRSFRGECADHRRNLSCIEVNPIIPQSAMTMA